MGLRGLTEEACGCWKAESCGKTRQATAAHACPVLTRPGSSRWLAGVQEGEHRLHVQHTLD